jgi:hypothetical protein
MTLADIPTSELYEGNGAATSWPFSFALPGQDAGSADLSVLYVYVINKATGEEEQVLDYTVELAEIGGSLTYPTSGPPLSSGFQLLIIRRLPYDQTTSILNQQRFYANIAEATYNRIVMQIQQLAEQSSRALSVSRGSPPVAPLAAGAGARAGRALVFSPDGHRLLAGPTAEDIAAASNTTEAWARIEFLLGTLPSGVARFRIVAEEGQQVFDLEHSYPISAPQTVLVFINSASLEPGSIGWEPEAPSGEISQLIRLAVPASAGDVIHGVVMPFTRAELPTVDWTNVAGKPQISITDFGASLSPLQTPTARTAAIQDALNAGAATGRQVVVPSGEWRINGTLRLPSYTVFRGEGKHLTTIKMADDAPAWLPVVQTGDLGEPRENIYISDMTLDYNRARWPAHTGSSALTVRSKTLAMVYTTGMQVERVCAIDAYGYNFDVTSPPPTNSGVLFYNPEPSRDVTLVDCDAHGAGDDNFTTRHSSGIAFIRCKSYDTSRLYGGISNGFEIDDGSRNVTITDCEAWRCEVGVQIKGHASPGAPAPHNVRVNNFTAVNCCVGFQIRNSGQNGSVSIVDDIPGSTETGFGVAANIIIVNGLQIIAPRRTNPAYTQVLHCIDIGNYGNVLFSNVTLSEGAEDFGGQEYLPAEPITSGYVVSMSTGARRIAFHNIIINGFHSATWGIRATSTVGGTDQRLGLVIDNLLVRDGPQYPVFIGVAAVKDIYIDNYFITGRHPVGGIGIRLAGEATENNHRYIGAGRVIGYETSVEWDERTFSQNISAFPGELHARTSINVWRGTEKPVTVARCHLGVSGGTAAIATRANSTSARDAVVFETPDGVAGRITTTDATTAYTTTSDERLKDRIEEMPLETAVEVLRLMQLHHFRWKATGAEDYGVFAQELHSVYPQAVVEGYTDAAGHEVPWSVDYSKLVPVYGRALQGILERMDWLK